VPVCGSETTNGSSPGVTVSQDGVTRRLPEG
jgi:hypothetical protein